jgi:hypothetical protein
MHNNELTAAKILTQIGIIANSYNELSLANILATIMRKKGERKNLTISLMKN